MNTFRPALVAVALVGTLAAGALGLTTFGGETREADAKAVCAAADWPLIPAGCLEGASNRHVRLIGDTGAAAGGKALAMEERFAAAFQ
jgi:hypothetical protein